MNAALIFFLSLTISGCVSVNLGGHNTHKADGIDFQMPSAPFVKEDNSNVDQSWIDPKTGNTISYLSECGDPADPGLTSIESGALSGLHSLQYLSQKKFSYNHRRARRVKVKGSVDGVPSMVDMIVFKKNGCIYILSYVGVEKHFSGGQDQFDEFVARFQAP